MEVNPNSLEAHVPSRSLAKPEYVLLQFELRLQVELFE